MRNYVIVDLEATCWEGCRPAEMEIIEIGAVLLSGIHLQPVWDYEQFVHPLENPKLTEFCRELTGIKQNQIDQAPDFPEAFSNFLKMIGPEPFKLCSWGEFDHELFLIECKRHSISMPDNTVDFINLKKLFSDIYDTKRSIGLRQAMRKLNMTFEGRHHRGIDDARNIARIAQQLLIPDLQVMSKEK